MGAAAQGETAYPDLPAARGPDADVIVGALGAEGAAGHGVPPISPYGVAILLTYTPTRVTQGGGGYSTLMTGLLARAVGTHDRRGRYVGPSLI